MEPITKVDWCFETNVKEEGYLFYKTHSINNITKDKYKYSANIYGKEVMVQFLDSKLDCIEDEECFCEDHEINGECKHSYALVCAINKIPKDLKVDFNEIDKNRETLCSCSFDDSIIFKQVDEKLASLNIDTLIKIRKELDARNEDTSLIDKAINERIRRDQANKEKNNLFGKSLLLSLLSGFGKNNKEIKNDKYLSPMEQEEVNKENYESYQFEEEDLEEDDYYFDDDK